MTGRDKIYRTIQYFAKFLIYYLTRKGYSKETVTKVTKLQKHLAISRKLIRIGRPVEFVQNLVNAISTQKDEVLRYLTVGKNLSLSVWLFWDFFVWANGVGIWKAQNAKLISQRSYKFWFYGLLCGWLSSVYQLNKNNQRLAVLQRSKKETGGKLPEVGIKEEKELRSARNKIVRQLFSESVDILIPANGLGYINVSDGFVGLCGTITGLMGIEAQWNKVVGGK
ncbi:peroxisomal biogenesis factor 11 [Paraphysoderma sedebokerense]|nr:peroxisomal biogenesis factor 11 [Paraphysoderma sedebokerense]